MNFTVVMKYVEDYSRLLLTVTEYDEYLTFYLLKCKIIICKILRDRLLSDNP